MELLRAADVEFEAPSFEDALADALRANPPLIDAWSLWCGDQRWTPSAGFDGVSTFWVASGGVTQHRRVHSDAAGAAADFIHRLAAWLARREVIEVES